MSDLKSCPAGHAGPHVKTRSAISKAWTIRCGYGLCDWSVSGISEEAAAEAWNDRAEPTTFVSGSGYPKTDGILYAVVDGNDLIVGKTTRDR
jgi:hypothetical protein